MLIPVIGFAAQGCTEDPLPSGTGRRAVYEIPEAFHPEPGPLDQTTNTRRIDAPEFSFLMTEEALAQAVDGFEPGLNGISHDTYIIVTVFDPDNAETQTQLEQTQPEKVRQHQIEIWTRTGRMSSACMAKDKEPLTGYYKYYTFCNPEPSPRSNFWLMDRLPDADQPAPDDLTYIKGVCREVKAFVRPEDGHYTRCKFGRKTSWNDRFSFWLKGNNLRYLDEVEAYIASLLLQWKS